MKEIPGLRCVEFFCGVASLARGWRAEGYMSRGFDLLRGGELHDLTSPLGVLTAFSAVLAMEVGSWGHLAVVCTSYCWINSGTHGRSAWRPEGETSHQYVRDGTRLAAVSSALALLLYLRGHIWTMENPVNSQLQNSSAVQYFVRWLKRKEEQGLEDASMLQFQVNLGDWGAPSLKPVWIYASEDLTEPLTTHGPDFAKRQESSSSAERPEVTIQSLAYESTLPQTVNLEDFAWFALLLRKVYGC